MNPDSHVLQALATALLTVLLQAAFWLAVLSWQSYQRRRAGIPDDGSPDSQLPEMQRCAVCSAPLFECARKVNELKGTCCAECSHSTTDLARARALLGGADEGGAAAERTIAPSSWHKAVNPDCERCGHSRSRHWGSVGGCRDPECVCVGFERAVIDLEAARRERASVPLTHDSDPCATCGQTRGMCRARLTAYPADRERYYDDDGGAWVATEQGWALACCCSACTHGAPP